jgi:general L-amino acid transport system substrate-binding protein
MHYSRKAIIIVLILALSALAFAAVSAQEEATGKLAEVLERGRLICGVNGVLPGFSNLDPDTNEMLGFDADFCRALAAAIFGEASDDTVEFVTVTAAERAAAIQTGQVDVLIRNTTWTLTRDTDWGASFGPTTFYDGQGLMVPAALGVGSIDDLDGASICTIAGTTTELNITDAMTARGLEFELIPFDDSAGTISAFEAGRCDVLTSDKSQLAALRADSTDPSLYSILPDTISKEPLGPAWLQGDAQWGNVVTWVVLATFQAEEFGITSANIDEMMDSDSPEIRRFLGLEGELGGLLGLNDDFAANAIRAVGNYGEIYDRHVTPLGIAREGTLNAPYWEGGLIYAPAWR